MSFLQGCSRLLIPDDNPSSHVDGIITAGALLAAESTRSETLLEGAGAVAVSLVLVWLAHSYAVAMGRQMDHGGEPLSLTRLGRAAAHELSMLRGAVVPLAVLVIAGLAGAGSRDAVLAALVTAVVLLVVFELTAAVRARLTPAALAVQVAICVAIGGGILLLKVILH